VNHAPLDEETAMIPNPTPVGLFLCDDVRAEEGTGFPSLISIFSARAFERFPTQPIPFFVYSILTGAEGTGTMELGVLFGKDNETIFSGTAPVSFPDRLAKVAVTILLDDLEFPFPGVYFFEAHVDGELIAQTRLQIFHHVN
jgi:Family of unknown function (DUF6941)